MASDNFNRADENPLAGNWETLSAANLQLSSNQVAGTSSLGMVGWKASTNTFTANHFSQARILIPGAGDNAGVAVRATNAGGGQAYISLWQQADGRIYTYKFVGGSPTNLGSTVQSLVSGDILKLTVETSGADALLKIWLNDVQVDTYTDSTSVIATGQPGLFYDLGNVNATRMDDWAGDNGLVPPAASSIAWLRA